MSVRVRIDFSVSFFYKVFYKGICVNMKGKHLDLEILFTLYVFLMFIRLSLFWVFKEASLHHLTVKFQSL